MSEPYLSEIRLFSFNFAPKYWALCNGQTLAINQYQALFSLVGITYGGNGLTTFCLPNLQGRVIVGTGTGYAGTYTIGQTGGVENVTLTSSTMPSHTHAVYADGATGSATTANPSNAYPGYNAAVPMYATSGTATYMSPTMAASASSAGSGGPHNNMGPYLALNYCIALSGFFPSQS